MWPGNYWATRYWNERYWVKVGEAPPPSVPGVGGPPGTFMPTAILPNPVNA